MKESLHDYMRVGSVHFMAYPQCAGGEGPILESIRRIALDPFFDVIEVAHIAFDETREKVKALCEEARVELIYGAHPTILANGLNLNAADAAERQTAIDRVKTCIDEAAAMGMKGLGLLSGKVSDDKDAAKARLVESLVALCAHGAPKGVSIVLETFDQVDYGKNCLIGPTADAVDVSQAVRGEYADFGLLLDLSHLPLIGEGSREAIDLAGDHLVHAHIGNCAMDDPSHPAYGDNHPRFGHPGTRNDVPELVEFLRVLLDAGFLNRERRPIVSFEVKPMAGEDPEAVLEGSKRTLVDAWRLV